VSNEMRATVRCFGCGAEVPDIEGHPLTVADLLAVREHHRFKDVVREYAEGVWSAWAKHHETIRHWVDDPGSLPRKA